jgi:hypothetical protein
MKRVQIMTVKEKTMVPIGSPLQLQAIKGSSNFVGFW